MFCPLDVLQDLLGTDGKITAGIEYLQPPDFRCYVLFVKGGAGDDGAEWFPNFVQCERVSLGGLFNDVECLLLGLIEA